MSPELTILLVPNQVGDAEGGGELQFHIRMALQEQKKNNNYKGGKSKKSNY